MESEKKQKLVIDGNAFYEIDLKCLEDKKKEQEETKEQNQKGRREVFCCSAALYVKNTVTCSIWVDADSREYAGRFSANDFSNIQRQQ